MMSFLSPSASIAESLTIRSETFFDPDDPVDVAEVRTVRDLVSGERRRI